MFPRRNDDIKSTLLPDGYTVLFNTKTEWVHTLNPSGALVWEFCDGTKSCADITEQISNLVPDMPSEDLEAQVSKLIAELLQLGLLTDAGVASHS